MLPTKKLPRKFLVLTSTKSARKLFMPLDFNTLNYIDKNLMSSSTEINQEESVFDYIDGDCLSQEKALPFLRISKLSPTSRWDKEKMIFPRKNACNGYSKCRIKLNDYEVMISYSLFQLLTNTYGLKYVSEGTSNYESDNVRTIYINDSMIPDTLTESMCQIGKLVDKRKESEIYGTETLLSYHYSNWHPKVADSFMKYMDKNKGAINFGFEAEKQDYNFRDMHNAIKLACETGFKKERDGSLGDGGFELISPVLPLNNDALINEVISPIREMLNSETTDKCGGHFNVSMVGTTSREMIKKIKGSLPIFYSIYSKRLDNSYCRAYQFATYLRSPRKYQAFYLKNNDILEFRIFPAIKNEQMLKNRIQLMRIIFNELYGSTPNKVIVSMATKNSSLYNFMLNIVCGGDIEKLKIKLADFCKKSLSYKCGVVTEHTKKRVNKLMGCDIFAPIVAPIVAESVSNPFHSDSNTQLENVLEEVYGTFENAQAVDNVFLNDSELRVDVLPSRLDEDFATINSHARINTDMNIVDIAINICSHVDIECRDSYENRYINLSYDDIHTRMASDRMEATYGGRLDSSYSLLIKKKYMRMFLYNVVAIRYKSFSFGSYALNFKLNGRDHYVKMSQKINIDGTHVVCGVFAKEGDGRKYFISMNLTSGIVNIYHA